MKKFLILAAMAMLFAACEKDPNNNNGGNEGPDDTPIALTFSDRGFALTDGTYTMNHRFIAGDRVGLYIVQDGNMLAENICMTASGSDSLTWTPSDASVAFPAGATYYAYYPYQVELPASIDASGADANGFFAPIVDAWTLPEDQSGAAFDVANLLIGSLQVTGGNNDNIELAPVMGVVEVGTSGTVYTFTNTDYVISDYSLGEEFLTFDGVTPRFKNGVYAVLVRPGSFSLTCSDSQIYSGSVGAGECFVAKESTAEVIEHNLQIGDFYLADGSLLSKDTPASDLANSDVLGVVVVIDPARIGEGERAALGGNAHALVFASMLAGYGTPYRWYTDYSRPEEYNTNYIRDESEIGLTTVPEISDLNALFAAAHADIEGYKNYHLIMTERAEDVAAGYYPCFSAVQNFTEEVGGPVEGVSTGWFLPASGQLLDAISGLCGGLELNANNITEAQEVGYMSWGGNGNLADKANEMFESIPWGKKIIFADNSNGMAAATQSSAEGYRFVDLGNHGFVDYNWSPKFTTPVVRPMLAF